jgi:hypothetical protein
MYKFDIAYFLTALNMYRFFHWYLIQTIIAKKSNHHSVRILQGIPIGIADDLDYCYALLVGNVHQFWGSFNNFLALFQMFLFEVCS